MPDCLRCRARITVILVMFLSPANMSAYADESLSDQQRLDLDKQCEDQHPFDFVAFGSWLGGIFTGNLAALAAPFIEGYKNGEGCDVFLTDAQKKARAAAEFKIQRDNQFFRPGTH